MSIEFKESNNAVVAVLPRCLDDLTGQELVAAVKAKLLRGAALVLDCGALQEMDVRGFLHLLSVRKYVSSPEHKNLLLAGMTPDLWRKIEDEGSEDMFSQRASVDEALLDFSGATGKKTAEQEPSPSVFETTHNQKRADAEPVEDENPWSMPSKSSPGTGGSTSAGKSSSEPPSAAGWEDWNKQKPKTKSKSGNGGNVAKPWIKYAGIACAVLLAIAIAWYFLLPGNPRLEVSAKEVEAKIGADPESMTVLVYNGELESDPLPVGLFFEPSESPENPRKYRLAGAAKETSKGGRVALTAVRGEKKSALQEVNFVIPQPAIKWRVKDLESLKLKVGQDIGKNNIFVEHASAVDQTGLPEGLVIQRSEGSSTTWELKGTPTKEGTSAVAFTAVGQTQNAVLTVEPADPVVVVVTPPANNVSTKPPPIETNTVVKPPEQSSTSPEPSLGVTDDMRQFLLERINKLDSRFTVPEIATLLLMVKQLKEARLIKRTVFERDGQTELSKEEKDKLRQALKQEENNTLLQDPDCQIFIVGYASPSGSYAANVRLSKKRAKNVDQIVTEALGRKADLCGDYGPTEIVDKMELGGNRAVEIFAGKLNLTDAAMRVAAKKFKEDFAEKHGVH